MALALASSAHAQGAINLAWYDCSTFGAQAATFACNTNTGSRTLYVSFALFAPLEHLQGTSGVIDICSDGRTLSQWWNLADAGHAGCRNAVSASADFTAGTFDCLDPWLGQAVAGYTYSYMFSGDRRARLQFVTSIPSEVAVTSDEEYYCVKLVITYTNTVGADACAGCLEPAFLMLSSLNLIQTAGNPSYQLTNPLNWNYVWFNGYPSFCFPTPTRNSTWGSVKALYR
jgi:hypothetical protein